MTPMKANQVLVKVIATDTADALTLQVNAFLADLGEATLLEVKYSIAGGATSGDDMIATYSCMIVYTN